MAELGKEPSSASISAASKPGSISMTLQGGTRLGQHGKLDSVVGKAMLGSFLKGGEAPVHKFKASLGYVVSTRLVWAAIK